MPTPLLVLLVVLAVAGGLYVGFSAGRHRSIDGKAPPKSVGARAREAATRGAVSVWRWNRSRKKKARDRDRDRARNKTREHDDL